MKECSEQYFDIIKIVIAFLLTSGLGSLIAAHFQNRAWTHQQEVKKREEEKSQAFAVFDDISKLLDRRLYRYRQIVYAFRSKDTDRIEKAFAEYRAVLFEWNDNLNRNYARIEIYFGIESRDELENKITKDIIFIGTLLERIKNNRKDAIPLEEVWGKIDHVNGLVYDFDKSLLKKVENSEVGNFRTQSSS